MNDMKVIRSGEFYTAPEQGQGIGLGNFDGVHLGHARLLDTLRRECARRGIPSLLYTFSVHPKSILQKDCPTPLIMTEQQRLAIFEDKKMDAVYLEDFTEEYAALSPEKFVEEILVKRFRAKLIVIGYDYTFGKMGAGKAQDLAGFGKKYGFDVIVLDPVELDGEKVSSTKLREFVQFGDMKAFARYAGRLYSIPGEVVMGRKVGRTLGFPTANILPKAGFALPGAGVYLTKTLVEGDSKLYDSITNIGANPTFSSRLPTTVETHIIDYNKGLYGERIEVFFVEKLRDEVRFDGPDMLAAQIKKDMETARRLISHNREVSMKKLAQVGDRIEIYHIPTNKFKTGGINITFCDNLSRERAYKNALIPMILCRGCRKYPTARDISKKFQSLYGADFTTNVDKKGEIQLIQFVADFVENKYAGNYKDLFREVASVMLQIITDPWTEDGGFKQDYFEQERRNNNDFIRSLKNDKKTYALLRCQEIMCGEEPFGVHEMGSPEDGEGLDARSLYAYYRDYFLRRLKVKIFVCSMETPDTLVELIKQTVPFTEGRGEDLRLGYAPSKMPAVKNVTEPCDVTQGKLTLGFRTNIDPRSEDFYALAVCNGIFGAGAHSKLFQNVREKNSLAYYAASRLERMKGLLIAYSGIEVENRDKAQTLILEQLEAIKAGKITSEEFEATVKMFENSFYSYKDTIFSIMDFHIGQNLLDKNLEIDDFIDKIKAVRMEDVVRVSQGIDLDTIYFLTGNEKEEVAHETV